MCFRARAAGEDAPRVTLQASVAFPVGAARQQSLSYVGFCRCLAVCCSCSPGGCQVGVRWRCFGGCWPGARVHCVCVLAVGCTTPALSDGSGLALAAWPLDRDGVHSLLRCALSLDRMLLRVSVVLAISVGAAGSRRGVQVGFLPYALASVAPVVLPSCALGMQLSCSVLLLLAGGVSAGAAQASSCAPLDATLKVGGALRARISVCVCCRCGRFALDFAGECRVSCRCGSAAVAALGWPRLSDEL